MIEYFVHATLLIDLLVQSSMRPRLRHLDNAFMTQTVLSRYLELIAVPLIAESSRYSGGLPTESLFSFCNGTSKFLHGMFNRFVVVFFVIEFLRDVLIIQLFSFELIVDILR